MTLEVAQRSFRLPRWRIAELLSLPRAGATRLAIGGTAADAYFRKLSDNVGRPPRDAEFAVYGEAVQVVPCTRRPRAERPEDARARSCAPRRARRTASRPLTVVRAAPERSTAEALAMGIDTRMASYKTYYSGTYDRITNLQLGVARARRHARRARRHLLAQRGDRRAHGGARLPARARSSSATSTRRRSAAARRRSRRRPSTPRGRRGCGSRERHPHSLYISRYQLGRDATVYWPSLDLKFVNDTTRGCSSEGFAEGDGISIAIYGGESTARRELGDAARRHRAGPGRARRGSDARRRASRSSRRRGRRRRARPRRARSTRPTAS